MKTRLLFLGITTKVMNKQTNEQTNEHTRSQYSLAEVIILQMQRAVKTYKIKPYSFPSISTRTTVLPLVIRTAEINASTFTSQQKQQHKFNKLLIELKAGID